MSRLAIIAEEFRKSAVGRWYYGREHSEQQIIAGLAVLVSVTILWAGAWKPVSDWRAIEINRQQNAQQLLDWMRANEQAARAAASSRQTQSGNRSLIPVITRAANVHELKLNRLQPESNGVISVILQQQSFNQIISWIAQLEENNRVSVQRASFDSEDSPGYVNAQIRLN